MFVIRLNGVIKVIDVEKNYSDKHMAVASYFKLKPSIIISVGDDSFCVSKGKHQSKNFIVLTKEEAMEKLKQCILNILDNKHTFKSLKFSFIATAIGVSEIDIKEFFLPEILLGEIRFDDDWIDIEPLKRYVQEKLSIDFFINAFSDFIMNTNSSGEFLCSRNSEIIHNGFHIYFL